jgi:hypothetical protein
MKLLICLLSLLGVALSATCPKYVCEASPLVQSNAKAKAEEAGKAALETWRLFQDMNDTGECYSHDGEDPVREIRTAKC